MINLKTLQQQMERVVAELNTLQEERKEHINRINKIDRRIKKISGESPEHNLPTCKFKKDTLVDRIYNALKDSTQPLTAPQILDIIKSNGYTSNAKNQPALIGHTLRKNDNIFESVSRGLYKVIDRQISVVNTKNPTEGTTANKICAILNKPMTVSEIMQKLHNTGFTSNSKNPKSVIYAILRQYNNLFVHVSKGRNGLWKRK